MRTDEVAKQDTALVRQTSRTRRLPLALCAATFFDVAAVMLVRAFNPSVLGPRPMLAFYLVAAASITLIALRKLPAGRWRSFVCLLVLFMLARGAYVIYECSAADAVGKLLTEDRMEYVRTRIEEHVSSHQMVPASLSDIGLGDVQDGWSQPLAYERDSDGRGYRLRARGVPRRFANDPSWLVEIRVRFDGETGD